MAKIQAFSSVSVVDLTDVGSINLYCTSNQPLSVIYDPNANNGAGSYSPNWATSNLTITPVISYNGRSISPTAQGVVITYTKKEGSGTATAIDSNSGETVSNGVLTVNVNKMASVVSGQLTYICKLEYKDPNTGVTLTTEASLTYTLVSQAVQIKDVDIVGETAFLYNADRTVVGTGTIVLKALLSNVSMGQWQYQTSNGTFSAYPINANNQSITTTELTVAANENNIWLQGDRYAVIRVTTNDPNVYDTIQINKILDGVAGDAVVSAVLTNESFLLPVDPEGHPISDNVWTAGATTIKIFEGGEDITSQWTIQANRSDGLTGSYNSTTHTFTPSSLSSDVGYVNFVCSKTGYSEIVKRYTITKQYSGSNGKHAVIYTVEPDYYALNRAENGALTPTSVTFSAYTKVGEDLIKSNYAGRFIIAELTNSPNAVYENKYSSSTDESSKSYTPSANTVIGIRCILYASGGTTTELDRQSIVITKDGKTGDAGANGNNGISMWLSNYSDVIPCTTGGLASAQKDISIPYSAYQGITRVPVTASVNTSALPLGVSVVTTASRAGTATSAGLLVLRVAKDAKFMNDVTVLTGDITITLTATITDANTGTTSTTSTDQKYTWTKNIQANNGANAVLLQLYSEDGGTVSTTKPNTTIKCMLTDGTTDVTSDTSISVTWAKFISGTGYTTIANQTGKSITIRADDVEDQMWLRCQATYGGKTYTAYYTIDDVSDPYVAYTFATVEQFKNSQGFGAVYTRVYQNGVEVDPIKSTVFSDTAPTGASNGDFYYHLNKTNQTCILKKYNGTSWVDATEKDTLNYNYYRLDNNGNALDTTQSFQPTRCFYIDPSIINGRMQFICSVTD